MRWATHRWPLCRLIHFNFLQCSVSVWCLYAFCSLTHFNLLQYSISVRCLYAFCGLTHFNLLQCSVSAWCLYAFSGSAHFCGKTPAVQLITLLIFALQMLVNLNIESIILIKFHFPSHTGFPTPRITWWRDKRILGNVTTTTSYNNSTVSQRPTSSQRSSQHPTSFPSSSEYPISSQRSSKLSTYSQRPTSSQRSPKLSALSQRSPALSQHLTSSQRSPQRFATVQNTIILGPLNDVLVRQPVSCTASNNPIAMEKTEQAYVKIFCE